MLLHWVVGLIDLLVVLYTKYSERVTELYGEDLQLKHRFVEPQSEMTQYIVQYASMVSFISLCVHLPFNVQWIKVFNIHVVQPQCHCYSTDMCRLVPNFNSLFAVDWNAKNEVRLCDVKVQFEKITCVSPSSGSLQFVGSQGTESWALRAAAMLFWSTVSLPGDRRQVGSLMFLLLTATLQLHTTAKTINYGCAILDKN